MVDSGAVCCAYETVERADRSLPLLIPMSEVAGRMAAQEGRYFLEKPRGGKGVLLGGVPGVKPAKVFVIGAGVVGTAAAQLRQPPCMLQITVTTNRSVTMTVKGKRQPAVRL